MYCENFKVKSEMKWFNILNFILCSDRLQHLVHAPAEAEQPEYCQVSPGGAGQVGLVMSSSLPDIIIDKPCPQSQNPQTPKPGDWGSHKNSMDHPPTYPS